jgi:hypothetical protein
VDNLWITSLDLSLDGLDTKVLLRLSVRLSANFLRIIARIPKVGYHFLST